MHCPHCGAESTFGLNYCKHCGGNLAGAAQPVQFIAPVRNIGWAAWAIALAATIITLGGLGIVFSHALELMQPPPYVQRLNDSPIPVVVIMIAFGSLTIFGVVAMMIRLFSRLMGVSQGNAHQERFNQMPWKNYAPKQIETPPAGVPSVTEHTTRNFKPIDAAPPQPPRRFNRQS